MNANKMFPSTYLKASDLEGHQPIVKIKKFEIETLGQGEDSDKKPVMYFEGKDKGLVCNKTNWNTLIELFGPDTDDWIGQSIKILAMEVQFKDKMTMALRISPQKVGGKLPAKKVEPEIEPEPDDLSGEEIPF